MSPFQINTAANEPGDGDTVLIIEDEEQHRRRSHPSSDFPTRQSDGGNDETPLPSCRVKVFFEDTNAPLRYVVPNGARHLLPSSAAYLRRPVTDPPWLMQSVVPRRSRRDHRVGQFPLAGGRQGAIQPG